MTNTLTQNLIADWFKTTSLSIEEQHKFLQEMFSKKNDKELIDWITESIPKQLKFHIDVIMEHHNKIINHYYINERIVSKRVYDFVKFMNSKAQNHDYSHTI